MTIAVLDKDGNPVTISTIDDLLAIIGAAVTSPSANTVQDRLKALATALATNHADEAALHSDIATTLAGLIASGNTSLGALVTALGSTALDYGVGTGGSRTQRIAIDTAQFGTAGPQIAANSTSVIDAGSGIATSWGVLGVPFTSANQSGAAASVTDAPTSGQHLVIDDIVFSTDTDMTVTFKEETTGTVVFGPWYCTAKSGPIQFTPRGKKKLATVDKKLQVITSVAGNITVQPSYHSEA